MKWFYVLVLCGAVLAENPDENTGVDNPDLFEGDMILTPEQRMAAEMGLDVDDPLGRASTMNRQWPGGVLPYIIDSRLAQEPKAVNAIKEGMADWSSKTCIKFKKRTNERAYINFRAGFGCASLVGFATGGKQDIELGSRCWQKGIVAHEIGHALGFYHEQSRPDRDQYVTIVLDNIMTGYEHNFNTQSTNSLGTPYDYGSLMHYGPTAFSKDGKSPTIIPKKPGVKIGQREGVSSIDAQQMNLLYKEQCEGGGEGGGGGGGGGSSCLDKNSKCSGWKSYCSFNSYVRESCQKTCELC